MEDLRVAVSSLEAAFEAEPDFDGCVALRSRVARMSRQLKKLEDRLTRLREQVQKRTEAACPGHDWETFYNTYDRYSECRICGKGVY